MEFDKSILTKANKTETALLKNTKIEAQQLIDFKKEQQEQLDIVKANQDKLYKHQQDMGVVIENMIYKAVKKKISQIEKGQERL